MANKKGSRQLTWTDRISIEALKKAGHSVIEIAEQLGVHRSTIFDDRTEEEVESIENWINGYPRKIHGYHSAGELFEEEVKQLA